MRNSEKLLGADEKSLPALRVEGSDTHSRSCGRRSMLLESAAYMTNPSERKSEGDISEARRCKTKTLRGVKRFVSAWIGESLGSGVCMHCRSWISATSNGSTTLPNGLMMLMMKLMEIIQHQVLLEYPLNQTRPQWSIHSLTKVEESYA